MVGGWVGGRGGEAAWRVHAQCGRGRAGVLSPAPVPTCALSPRPSLPAVRCRGQPERGGCRLGGAAAGGKQRTSQLVRQTSTRRCRRQAAPLASSTRGVSCAVARALCPSLSSPCCVLTQDLEACYVCWDILWADGRQLSQLPLLERHRLLRQAICPAPPEGQPRGWWRPGGGRETVCGLFCGWLHAAAAVLGEARRGAGRVLALTVMPSLGEFPCGASEKRAWMGRAAEPAAPHLARVKYVSVDSLPEAIRLP